MNKKVLIILILVLGNFSYSQKQELDNVTIAQLQEKVHPTDSSAVASILMNKGRTYFEFDERGKFKVITDVEVKIKIYKKEGYDWANKEVQYYIGNSDKEEVNFSKAFTYNLVNGKVEKTKLKSDNEFTARDNKFWSSKKIVMPNVAEGSIIEYKYSIKSPFLTSLQDWKFQKSIPVNYSEYTTEIPEYYIYNVYRKGVIMPNEKKETLSRTLRFARETVTTSVNIYQGKAAASTTNYTVNKTTYKLENIQAIKDESFVNNINNYSIGLQHELSGIQMPQEQFESFSTTWENVAKRIYENEDFGSQLSKNNYFENDLKIVLEGISSPSEKMQLVFNFVKSKINWNGYNGYLTDVGVKKAFQDKTGNVAEINLMMVSMLRYAGIKSNPVLISTRANGISFFPTRTGFNYVIASAEIDGKTVLLDASSKNSLPNILPLKVLNWNGRTVEKDGTSEIVDVMPEFNSSNSINLLVTIDQKGDVTGKIREQYNDYYALRFRDNLNSFTNDAIVEKIETNNAGLEVSEYEVANKNTLVEAVVEKYTIKNTNASEVIGDKIYFSPLFHLAMKENPFKQETREYPIDFSFPTNNRYRVYITIPDGYSVENLPKSSKINMENNYGNFVYSISTTGNQIQLVLELNINSSIVPPEDYETIKEFYKLFIEKNNEKVILRKA